MTIGELNQKIKSIEERLRKEAHLLSPKKREQIEELLEELNDRFIAECNRISAQS